jgi:hypothetical protein
MGSLFVDAKAQPRKVNRLGASASDMSMVMVVFFGHLGGKELAAGDLGNGGASVIRSPIPCFEGRNRGW